MKHPVLANRVRLIVWWLVWLFMTLGQLLLYYYAYGRFTTTAIPDGIISLIIYSGIGLSLWYPFRYFNATSSRTTAVITNLVVSGAVAVTLWVLINKYFVLLILPKVNDYQAYWEATFPYRIGTGVFIYGLIVLAYYLFISLYNLSEKNAKEAKLESLVKETELKMLRSQINPHFLFNSLNSVSSLTITDPEKARDMVIKLSEFMRYALSKKDEQPVSLRSELENLRLYLDIEKVRFGDKLSTEENIEEKCLETKMPVMLLQPLYENAIKHGVYESTESVRIITQAKIIDGYIEITICNNYDPAPSLRRGTGTGLINVARRLELFYGNKASIKTTKENGIYTVNLYIPTDFL
ncbi:MAG: histidine kinase [Bacteroidales bacterium]|nr:histidine kinase [Bacteroidales bacterium]